MLRILADESTIRRCQRQFIRALKPFVTERIAVKIGHPGESVRANLFWAGDPGIWFYCKSIAGDRFWNAFGIGRPSAGGAVSSTIEINVPILSLDRKLGGAFARDDTGKVFLVHRGKIGGRRGVGKSLFEAHYRGVWSEVEDGDTLSTVVVVGELQSPLFVRHLTQFVRKVEAIKYDRTDDGSQTKISFDDDRFREEFIGSRYAPEQRDYASECERDLAELDLSRRLKELGCRVKGGPEGGLVAHDAAGNIAAVFEVVAAAGSPSLEYGVARLLLKSLDLPPQARRVLAVPGTQETGREDLLRKMGIHVTSFFWDSGMASFRGLPGLLAGTGG